MKSKLALDELRIKSFITSFDAKKIKGGVDTGSVTDPTSVSNQSNQNEEPLG